MASLELFGPGSAARSKLARAGVFSRAGSAALASDG